MPSSRQRLSVGVCVLNRNSGRQLIDCVSRLQQAESLFDLDLVVVDNASQDGSLGRLLEEVPGVRVIRNAVDVGSAAGNNRGGRLLQTFGCDHVVFVDPAVRIEPASLAHLIAALEADEENGCAGGVPIDKTGQVGAVARNRPTVLEKIVLSGPLRHIPILQRWCRGHWIFTDELSGGAGVYAVSGWCMAFRSDALRLTGGFDERVFLYEQELIMAERLLRTDWRTVVAKDARYQVIPREERISTEELRHRSEGEFHLLRAYYRWNPALCTGLLWYRRLEWFVSLPASVLSALSALGRESA